MSGPKSIEVESLIAQTREALDHPISPPWTDAKKVMAFLCDAMEALVGEVRSSRKAEDALKARLAGAEARAERAVALLKDAEKYGSIGCRSDYEGHIGCADDVDLWERSRWMDRIAALLKEVPHGQQG